MRGEKGNFNNLIPTLLVNPSNGESEQAYKANIGSQLYRLAFIVVRGNALQRSEETIEKEVGIYFASSKAEEDIRKGVRKIGDIELEKIYERFEVIEEALKYNEILVDKLGLDDEKETEQTD